MKAFHPTLLTATLLMLVQLAFGQGVGTPNQTIQFDTSPQASGGVAPFAHLQAGTFGNIFTGTWASIGQAPVIPGIPNTPYGIRLQRIASFGVLNFVNNGTSDELILGFGQGPSIVPAGSSPALRFRYISNQFAGQFQDIMSITLSQLDGQALVGIGNSNTTRDARLNVVNKGQTGDFTPTLGEGIALYTIQGGDNPTTTSRSYAVLAEQDGGAGIGFGVFGRSVGASTNYGVYGETVSNGGSVNIGVRGDATNATIANYGVLGRASTGPNDYAVFASGNLAYTGTFGQVSDRQLKKNIESIESALNTVMSLRPTSYTYRQDEFEGMSLPQGLSYGFIAQEVEEVMPELVMEITHPFEAEEEGAPLRFETFKGLKYTELIPVLTAAIQEQQEVIQAQQEAMAAMQAEIRDLQAGQSADTETGSLNPKFNSFGQAQLFQNRPNPFKEATIIRYQLPKEAERAEIYVFDMQGQQIATYTNLDQSGELTIQAAALNAGMYLYSLVINGQEVDTKRMILTK
ncbi:MAG: tail fiber domain-containing protein [Bacteroidota bacterium]